MVYARFRERCRSSCITLTHAEYLRITSFMIKRQSAPPNSLRMHEGVYLFSYTKVRDFPFSFAFPSSFPLYPIFCILLSFYLKPTLEISLHVSGFPSCYTSFHVISLASVLICQVVFVVFLLLDDGNDGE